MKGEIIAGTGDARKIRMKATGRGKRGGYRVIYYFRLANQVYFLTIYSKAVKEDLSESEKKQIRVLIQQLKRQI